MLKRATLPAMILALALIAGGCGLLGLGGTSQTGTRDIEATIYEAAAAGEAKDADTIAAYLATSIVTQILDDTENTPAEVLEGNHATISRIRTIWDGKVMNSIEASIGDITVLGNRAEVVGAFDIEFTDDFGTHVACTGYAAVSLELIDGVWKFTRVTVQDSACLIDGEEPGDGDDDPNPPQPGDGNGDGDLDPPDGIPAYHFETCAYQVTGYEGEQAAAVQSSLDFLGYSPGKVDGYYGPMTVAAVRAFQTDHGLHVDGEYGPKTHEVMARVLREKGASFDCDTVDTEPQFGSTTLSMSALRKGTAFESPIYTYEADTSGPALVFVGCIHGNEQSGHLALMDAINRGITINRGRLIVIPAINQLACDQNRRTLNRSTSLLSGKDFNRMFPVGGTPTYTIAKEMWDLLNSQNDLAFVVDFHDGFINSLGNTLLHTRQTKAGSVARKLRDALNRMRPSNARGPSWRAFTEPISGSLIRKVGRDLSTPGILVELSGRNPGDPLALRKDYAWTIIKMIGEEFGMTIDF